MPPTITEIVAAPLRHPEVLGRSLAPVASWGPWGLMHPLSKDRSFAGQSQRFTPPWGEVVCVATASDGTFGVGMTSQAGPVVPIINDFLHRRRCGAASAIAASTWGVLRATTL